MLRWFYLSRETRFRLVLLFLLFLYFAPWWSIFFLVLSYIALLFLFYRKQINFTSRRALEDNLILSPVSGKVVNIDKSDNERVRLDVKMRLFDDYGILMPFYGDVIFYQRTDKGLEEFEASSGKIEFTKILIEKSLFKPRIFVRAGDKASSGVFLGYKPFGGIIKIEVPVDCEILVKEGDEILSAQTILASI